MIVLLVEVIRQALLVTWFCFWDPKIKNKKDISNLIILNIAQIAKNAREKVPGQHRMIRIVLG